MWADALQHTALQSLTADVASERIPAQGYMGMGVQNLSPYVVQLVADTGRVLLQVPPWTQSTHTPDVSCSYVIAQTVLAASPATLATVLQQYQVRVLLTHAALPERMEPLASSAALLGSLAPVATKEGVLVQGPITVAASATYETPSLNTNGYHYATIVPAAVSGSFSLLGTRQSVQGTLAWINNSGNQPPPGMGANGGALGWSAPINDAIFGGWINSSSTATLTLGDILYVLSA